MNSRWHRFLKSTAPWLAGLILAVAGFWMWDFRGYPIPRVIDPATSPVGPGNLAQRTAWALREAKEKRFWKSFKLPGTAWKATHRKSGTTSTIRFTDTHIHVDPPEVKIGIPFVDDSAYERLDSRTIWTTIPVPGEGGTVMADEWQANFFYGRSKGTLYLLTNRTDGFSLEKIR